MTTTTKAVTTLALTLALGVLAGCSLGLSASSTCDQYIRTEQRARWTAAQDLGRSSPGSTFKGPMAGLNLDYSCSYGKGTRTIGSIMKIPA